MDLGLTNKVVLVTGASGGIGFVIAEAFAREGARVVANFRTYKPERAKELASVVRSGNGRGMLHACDLTSIESVQELFEKIVEQMSGLPHIIVNNVGVSADGNRISELSTEDFDQLYRVNLRSCFFVTRELQRRLELMTPSKRFPVSIVNIASTAGLYGEWGNAGYSAMKAGILGLSRSAAVELARLAPGSRVNTVAPGWVVGTGMSAGLTQNKGAVIRAMMTRKVPDLGEPEDVANAVLFLASNKCSRMTTGQVFLVDGGMDERVIWMRDELEPHYAGLRTRHPELPE